MAEGKVYSHHAADPLANGHQNDAFEVFCLLEHGGDQPKAVKEAARMLGMQSTRPSASDLPRPQLRLVTSQIQQHLMPKARRLLHLTGAGRS